MQIVARRIIGDSEFDVFKDELGGKALMRTSENCHNEGVRASLIHFIGEFSETKHEAQKKT